MTETHVQSPLLYLQQKWVSTHCITSIAVILITFALHRILLRFNPIFYGRSPLMDKMTVLMNLNFAILYSLVVVPFTVASMRIVFLDAIKETFRNAFSINLGLNTLAVMFLWEGILVSSLKPNLLLVFHHVTFFFFVFAFTITQSILILQVGLVLGCFTTWQIFPRVTATLRFLGIRRRKQKVVAFGSVIVGFLTRLVLGPIGLIKVIWNGYHSMTESLSSKLTFGITFLVIIMLLYMEFEGFVRHMRLHDKLKVLAAQSLINIQKLSQSLIRSSKKVSGASPDGEKSAAADTARSSGPSAIPTRSPFEGVPVSQVKEGKPSASQNKHSGLSMLKSMVTTVQEFALEGGERYLQEIEEAERKSAQDLAQSNVSSATDKPKDS